MHHKVITKVHIKKYSKQTFKHFFDLHIKKSENSEEFPLMKGGIWGSNPRPSEPQSDALTN